MIGYEKLFRYDDWANREALGSLPRGGVDSPLARSRMAHIIAAERLWHARLTRDPARVLTDVLEGYESIGKARDVYGVVFTGKIEDDTLAVDAAATAARRAEIAKTNGAKAHASS